MLLTRGVPGTHDINMMLDFFKKSKAKKFKNMKLPKFNKAIDDRFPKNKWNKINKRPDVIIFDDLMQHRYVTPHCLVITTSFNQIFFDDHLLRVVIGGFRN